jgi:hypothetical protein
MVNKLRQISLLEFVDYYFRNASQKNAKLKTFVDKYDKDHDFYKIVRETIVRIHKKSLEPAILESVIGKTRNNTKLKQYPKIVDSYKEWWGRRDLKWFKPPKAPFVKHGVQISINPELGLIIDGSPYLIKLYFKKPIFQPIWADMTISLMSCLLPKLCNNPQSTKIAVLDIRREELFTNTTGIQHFESGIDNELSHIARYFKLE